MPENKKIKILEEDLFKPIHKYFETLGYKVHGEVHDCDMTVSSGDELIIVELKRNLSVDLLIQGVKRQRLCENVYVAIPRPEKLLSRKNWQDILMLLKRLELGLILVSFRKNSQSVEIVHHPSSFDLSKSRKRNVHKKTNLQKEIDGRHGNFNTGGTNRKKIMTAYKENCLHIACCLKKFGPLSPKKLRELGTGKKTLSILNKNFYGWYNKLSKGLYSLGSTTNDPFDAYPELTKYYFDSIEKYEEIK